MYQQLIDYLKNKRIVLLGMGREGHSTYNFIRRYLPEQKLIIADAKQVEIDDPNVELLCGDGYLDAINRADTVIKAPGVPLLHWKRPQGVEITCQTDLFLRYSGFNCVGVTGTKGKTTTSYMIQAITNALAGRPTGLSSSAGRYCGGPDVDIHLTTPESLDLQWLFAQARDHGLPYMTAEVSSQAYQVERVYGEHFDIGVFLNFSEDHISPKEHASMEEYLQCKLHLLENSSRAVICRETAQFDRVYDTARRCCRETLLVGMDRDDCDLTVRQVEKLEHGFRFAVQERGSQTLHHYHLAMDGDFNIENALAAIGVGRLLGAGHDRMAAALDSLVVPGRMNRYEGGGVHVLVDCMHNRASSQALLTDLKRDYPGAPITVVTGIAGGRSPQRIQGMGEMCGKYADRIFFTTDNPDFDDPGDIASRLAHAAAQGGPARVTIQLDRTRAVEQAILEAPAGAVIVLAGKGNDAIQRVRGGYVHYDSDPVVAKRALALREKKQ